MMPVHVEDPEHMHLLGLLLKGFLERQLAIPAVQRKTLGLRGEFGVSAGAMAVTLSFTDGGVLVKKGITATARARVGGDMRTMVDLVAGDAKLWTIGRALLSGRVRVSGNLLALLPLLPVMLATAPDARVS